MDTLTISTNGSVPVSGTIDHSATGTTTSIAQYGYPQMVKTIINHDNIEIIFKQKLLHNFWPNTLSDKVYKEIYGVVDGKFGKIEIIEGKIIPEYHSEEDYEFDK